MDKFYVLPRVNSLGAYFVKVRFSDVRFQYNAQRVQENVEHRNLVSVSTDMQFNPLQEKIEKARGSYYEPITREQAVEILQDFSPIEIKKGFDGHDVDDLNEISSFLPENWIEKYNSLHEIKIKI